MNLIKTDRLMVALGRQIMSGEYLPNTTLPAGTDLCEELATSCNIIREVSRSLEAKRLIEMRRYHGAFVVPCSQWDFLGSDISQRALERDENPGLIVAMSEVRNLVEPAMTRWVTEQTTSSDLAQIKAVLNDMIANNQQRDAFNEVNIHYHEAVLASVHNPVLRQLSAVVSPLQCVALERIWMGDEANIPWTPQEHKALFDTIRHRDSNAVGHTALTMIASSTRGLKEAT